MENRPEDNLNPEDIQEINRIAKNELSPEDIEQINRLSPEDIQEINRIGASAAKVLKQNPNAKIFVPIHDGKEWRIWDALALVWYSKKEFKSRFGYVPNLPQIPAEGRMVVVKKRKKDFWEL